MIMVDFFEQSQEGGNYPGLLVLKLHKGEKMSKSRRNLFNRYPLILFFVLSYLLSWWTVPFMEGALFPYGPTLAAILILVLSQGRHGLRKWWGRLTQWRAGWWYLAGPVIMMISLLAAFGLFSLFRRTGAVVPGLPVPAIWLELLLLGGLWEEPGWTGYALPELQQRFSRQKNGILIATMLMALFRAIWHIPLLVRGTLPWFDVFGYILAFQVIISWLYNRSGGSVPAVMLFHFSSNLFAGGMMLRAFSGDERLFYWMLFAACTGLIALIILVAEGSSLGERTHLAGAKISDLPSGED